MNDYGHHGLHGIPVHMNEINHYPILNDSCYCGLHRNSIHSMTFLLGMDFLLVKFPDEEDSIAVVYAKWIRGGVCLWPTEKTQEGFNIVL